MNAVAAFVTGTGLGVVSFGSLWFAVSRAAAGRGRRVWFPLGRLARLLLAAATFYALGREGTGVLLAGLGGFLAVRTAFVTRLRRAP